MAAKPISPVTTIAMNEALLLCSLRQHELIEAAENLNARLEAEISARQQAAGDLAEKVRLWDLTHDAIIVCGLDGRITYWNRGAEDLYGWSCDEALGKVSHRLFKSVFPQPVKQITAELRRTADTRKRLEAEIAGVIEGERERLGQELHDGLVQELTGIVMMLHVLAQTLKRSDPASASEVNRLCKMLEMAHGNARDLAKNFYPVELEHHGLQVALEGIAVRTRQQYGLQCVVQASARARTSVKDLTSVQLFRIAQEAVQNAAKHAQATKMLIRLVKEKDLWLLTVKDDGVGLRNDTPEAAHHAIPRGDHPTHAVGGQCQRRRRPRVLQSPGRWAAVRLGSHLKTQPNPRSPSLDPSQSSCAQ